jgi:transcriptional regulator with XRE-family HTH domain
VWKTTAASEADETLSACFASLCLQFAARVVIAAYTYSPRESGRDNPSVIKLQFLGRKLSSKVVKLVNIILGENVRLCVESETLPHFLLRLHEINLCACGQKRGKENTEGSLNFENSFAAKQIKTNPTVFTLKTMKHTKTSLN